MEGKDGDGDTPVDQQATADEEQVESGEGQTGHRAESWETASNASSEADNDDDVKIKRPLDKPEPKNFTFYNFGYHLIPFHDLLDSFYSLRKAFVHRNDKKKLSSTADSLENGAHSHTNNTRKTFDIQEFQKTKEIANQNTKLHKISRFHPVEPKWDGTMVVDDALLATLYRTPQSDPSGKVIFSVVRDEAKDAIPWKQPPRGSDFPIPTLDKCNPRLQLQILAHMNETVAKVEEEYSKMPSRTQAESELKARMGADLFCLQQQRKQLMKLVNKEKKKKGLKPSARGGADVLFGNV